MPEPSEYDLCAAFHALRHAMIFLMSRLSSADQQEIVRTCRKTATADECALGTVNASADTEPMKEPRP